MNKENLYTIICKNRLLKQLTQRILRFKYERVPPEVVIETTNLCNLDCIMCPRKGMHRPLGHMDKRLFERIVKQAVSVGVQAIFLHNYGEPLMLADNDFAYFLNYIRSLSKNILIKLDTNGMLLTEKKIEIILSNEVNDVTITLGGATSQTHGNIFRGGSLEVVEENISNLIDYKRKLNMVLPQVSINIIRMTSNQHEIGDFLNKWKGVADKVSINEYSTRAGSLSDQSINKIALRPIPCFRLWKQMVICNDGKVALCCNDWDCRYPLGDLNKQSIFQIWQSKEIKRIRYHHLNKQRENIPICSLCFPERWNSYPVWWC